MDTPVSKESLLQQADALRELARRARRLSGNLTSEADRHRLLRHGAEMEDSAARLEKQAVDAKTFVLNPIPGLQPLR
jgi:hypothetical protein